MRTAGWAVLLPLVLAVVGCNAGPGGPAATATAPVGTGAPTSTPGGSPIASVPPAGGPINLTPGPDLCALLTAADFSAVGVVGAGPVKKNAYDNSFYCTYAGLSSATGGIELDAFIVTNPSDVQGTFDGVAPLFGAEDVTAAVAGAEQALAATMVSGGPEFAQIAVRSGNFVFGLGIPSTGDWHAQLTALASLILARAAAVAGGAASLPPQLDLPDDLCTWVTAEDLRPFSDESLTPKGEPEISGSVYFTGTQGTYLGKQVTCRYGYGDDPNSWMGGLIMDVGATPNDDALAAKIYQEQLDYYAGLAAGGGSNGYTITPLTGVGTAAQKVRTFYKDDQSFISWTAEALQSPIVVRMVLDDGFDRTKPDSDVALVTLLGKILDQAVNSITVP